MKKVLSQIWVIDLPGGHFFTKRKQEKTESVARPGGRQGGEGDVLRRHGGGSLCRVDQDLFAHRTLTDLVEGLDHDGVLGEHLQVGDLKLVLVGLPSRHGLTHELDSFEEVGFVVTMAVEVRGWLNVTHQKLA